HCNGKVNGMVANNNRGRSHHQQPDYEENMASPPPNNGRWCQHSDGNEEFDSNMLREEYQLAGIEFQIRHEVNSE
ncbi:uncharacterized protein SETTUDRAFT_97229, partial [Exserohilum turcica Et28A]